MHEHSFDLESTNVTPEMIGVFGCVLLATDHEAVDYVMV